MNKGLTSAAVKDVYLGRFHHFLKLIYHFLFKLVQWEIFHFFVSTLGLSLFQLQYVLSLGLKLCKETGKTTNSICTMIVFITCEITKDVVVMKRIGAFC